MKACKKCNYLMEEGEKCLLCGAELSKDWQGYIVVLDYSRSQIAQKMNITANGRFALKVKQ
jgi:DNA-directed RNA polymerase subunit E"